MLCLPATKAALLSAAVVSFLVTTGTDVYSITVPYASVDCSFGVWTTACSNEGLSLSFSSSDKRFKYYRAAIVTEIIQIAAIIFGSFAALWYIISVVVLMQSQKPMSWKGCGIALHVTATVFGALLPITMGIWKALNDSEGGATSSSDVVNKTLGPAMYFAIFGSILVVTSSFLACAECCGGGEVQTSAQPLQQVLYYPAPGNAVVEAVGSGARMGHPYPGPLPTTAQPYASVQMAE